LSESHIPINIVHNNVLDIPQFMESNFANKNAINIFLCKNGYWINGTYVGNSEEVPKFYTKPEIEKMSKSKYNVINPDDVVGEYGADAFRLYEMFLGPIEQHKPWDTKGIDGVYRFLKKMWKLFYDENGKWLVTNDAPSTEELKVLHRTIKKVAEDIERLSFNTSVSAFMICVNELTQLNCHKKEILEALLIILSPYAPFVTEYLWEQSGNKSSIVHASFPVYDESLLVENAFEYPIAINGKTRLKMNFALDLPIDQIEQAVKENEGLQKYFEGKSPKKVIVVKGRMINVVV
ncbi:MAG: class I tRNA ligase family protein, partial [Chitinophagales bacterium]